MPAKQRTEQPTDQDGPEPQRLLTLIGKRVMALLGRPADLQVVQVRQVWDALYRVNVMVGEDLSRTRVAHSYFLVTDDDANILASTPRITSQY
jgi:hypothetical protein